MNLKFIRIMVEKENWREQVASLISPYSDVIASPVDETKHGYLVSIGHKDREVLDKILEKASEL